MASCCHKRNVFDNMAEPMARQRMRNMWCDIRWTFDPVSEPKSATRQYLRKRRHGCTSLVKKMLLRRFTGHMLPAVRGWSGYLLIAECEDVGNLSSSDIHVKRLHKKESFNFHVQTNLSNSSIFLNLHAATCPPGDNPEHDAERRRGYLFRERKR